MGHFTSPVPFLLPTKLVSILPYLPNLKGQLIPSLNQVSPSPNPLVHLTPRPSSKQFCLEWRKASQWNDLWPVLSMFYNCKLIIINYASVLSLTYDHILPSLLRLAYYENSYFKAVKSFITLATVIKIVNYDHKTYKVQASNNYFMTF
jgi:hypothetical protein